MKAEFALSERLMVFKKACAAHGCRLTPQKVAIFKALAENDCHPFAEDLHKNLKADYPNMSLATVYKNLAKFVRMGIAHELDFGEGRSRFDANMNDHCHVVNLDKNEVKDYQLNEITENQVKEKYNLQKVSLIYFVREKL